MHQTWTGTPVSQSLLKLEMASLGFTCSQWLYTELLQFTSIAQTHYTQHIKNHYTQQANFLSLTQRYCTSMVSSQSQYELEPSILILPSSNFYLLSKFMHGISLNTELI